MDKIEWIIIDDGTDKIQDLVSHIPQVKYYKYNNQMSLGKKRNLMHQKTSGEYIIYMDDDDYYPPERIEHAVNSLQNSVYSIAGCSKLIMYFNEYDRIYQMGPYNESHATAASFAFKRSFLTELNTYDDNCNFGEEKHFLKNYTIPLLQLDTSKTIFVFSHIHNTFDKKKLIQYGNTLFVTYLCDKKLSDYIIDKESYNFIKYHINNILKSYDQGQLKYKPCVIKQLNNMSVQ
jgi:glycosyltransferase involved in cell wall biosynthesis